MLAWYVAITLQLSELIAEQNLRRQNFSPFLPRVRETRITRGREVTTVKPYIPGYIFVRFDRETDDWGRINSTRGVRSLMCNSPELPTRVRDQAMAAVLERCDGQYVIAEEIDETLMAFFPVGSMVKVVEGPLAGQIGKVQLSYADRVRVLFHIFGRQTKVEMAAAAVDLVT